MVDLSALPSAPAPAPAPPLGPQILVLLSERLDPLGIDLRALAEWLDHELSGVVAHAVPDLRRHPGAVAELAAATGAQRLVLGLAGGEYVAAPLQAQARRGHLDPLAMEALDLEAHAASFGGAQALERAKVLLAGAVARMRAFPGSRREHLKTSLSVAMSRRALFTLSIQEYVAVPALAAERCAAGQGCQLCVRACPQGALRPQDGRVELDKARCESCGLCLQACPAGALELPGYGPGELDARLAALLDPSIGDLGPRGVLIVCRGTLGAMEAARGHERPYLAGWLPVVVPCAAMLSPAWFLRCLALGAAAVRVVPCGGHCPSAQDVAIAERVAFCQELLARMGAGQDHVALCRLDTRDQALWTLPTLRAHSIASNIPLPLGEGRVRAGAPRGSHPPASASGPPNPRAAAEALLALAKAHGAPPDLALEHPASPFGLLDLDAEACTGCEACAAACPTGALSAERDAHRLAISFDTALCSACALCTPRCPEADRGALRLRRATDLGALGQGRRLLYEGHVAFCAYCGARLAPDALMDRVASLIGPGFGNLEPYVSRICSDCRSEAPFLPTRPAA